MQRAAWALVSTFGAKALPGRTQEWEPPMEHDAWIAFLDRLEAEIGPFDLLSIQLRRPASREGMALLAVRGKAPVAFVKLRTIDDGKLEQERVALEALSRRSLSFASPEPLAWGHMNGSKYLSMSALPLGIHTMAKDPPVHRIGADIASALADAVARPPDAGADWVPIHGDFTAWNLRSVAGGGLVLFDWEDATWGPPGADLLWYDAVQSVKKLPGGLLGTGYGREVVDFWIERLDRRVVPGERSLNATILRRLRDGTLP